MSFVNLLPDDYLARQAQRRTNLLCLILFAAVMVGVLLAAFVSDRRLQETRQVHEQVNDSYAEAAKLIQQMQELEAVKQQMFKKAKLTAGLLERVPRSYLLAMVTNALPPGGSLKKLDLTTKRHGSIVVSRETKTRYGKTAAKRRAEGKRPSSMNVSIAVIGLAATHGEVAEFYASVARCPLVNRVDLVYSQEKEFQKVLVREFKMVLHLKANADVLDGPDQGGKALARAGESRPAGEDR